MNQSFNQRNLGIRDAIPEPHLFTLFSKQYISYILFVMSILLGNCNDNIENHYVDCAGKQRVIKDIRSALHRLGVKFDTVRKIKNGDNNSNNEILWIRDIFVPVDNIYIKCNLTKNSTMNTDRSKEFEHIHPYLDTNKPVVKMPNSIPFEGGDFIECDNYLFVGIGQRTSIQIVDRLKRLFPNKGIIPIHHSALHLDCCFCALQNKTVFYDSKYIQKIELPRLFTCYDISPIADSGKYLATNFIQVGNTLVMSNTKQNATFRKILRKLGYSLVLINIGDLWKEGGGIRCLTQWL